MHVTAATVGVAQKFEVVTQTEWAPLSVCGTGVPVASADCSIYFQSLNPVPTWRWGSGILSVVQ